jgi:hypothetical protein
VFKGTQSEQIRFLGITLGDIDSRNVLECGGSSHRLPNAPHTGKGQESRYPILVMVMQKNDCRELRERRWLLPPHSKALRAQWDNDGELAARMVRLERLG